MKPDSTCLWHVGSCSLSSIWQPLVSFCYNHVRFIFVQAFIIFLHERHGVLDFASLIYKAWCMILKPETELSREDKGTFFGVVFFIFRLVYFIFVFRFPFAFLQPFEPISFFSSHIFSSLAFCFIFFLFLVFCEANWSRMMEFVVDKLEIWFLWVLVCN